MNDPVNNPSHYNQNGIEVIDVIETYAKDDFRLANVIKYVCRAGYKGNKLQDLNKAQWYLNRCVQELEVEQALEDESWIGRHATMGAGPIPEKVYEIPYNPQDAHNKFCEEQEAHLPPDRIAGDDEAATRIKDAYYNFDRFEIRGYCASCDAEISATQPFVKDHNQFDEGLMFCNHQCITSLTEWQKDWTL